MKWLQNTYTGRFSVRHGQWGPLFGDRYKSVLVEGEGYYCDYETLLEELPEAIYPRCSWRNCSHGEERSGWVVAPNPNLVTPNPGSAKSAAIPKPGPTGWIFWQSRNCGLNVCDSRMWSVFLAIPTDCGLLAFSLFQ
jgi:hypothetical protein